ncbi:hypothetical protein [Bacillus cihuensis]|uniref:hypothetical protein n=1 Tax=Bacillus cihuensis TaxID=1208599 RepID=UPI000413F109|nr:hypothetical protein [Bacillus cihuensis]
MIIKKEGKINEIIYEYTTINSGKSRLYPTITDLNGILEKIIESKSTTEYIRINPFYINEKINMQIEFEEFMFYLECREQFDKKALKDHILDCLDAHYPTVSTEQFEMGKILYPLCQHNDLKSYKLSLEKYRDYLGTLLPRLFDYAKRKMQLKDDDLAFGYFCFEVHSG